MEEREKLKLPEVFFNFVTGKGIMNPWQQQKYTARYQNVPIAISWWRIGKSKKMVEIAKRYNQTMYWAAGEIALSLFEWLLELVPQTTRLSLWLAIVQAHGGGLWDGLIEYGRKG